MQDHLRGPAFRGTAAVTGDRAAHLEQRAGAAGSCACLRVAFGVVRRDRRDQALRVRVRGRMQDLFGVARLADHAVAQHDDAIGHLRNHGQVCDTYTALIP